MKPSEITIMNEDEVWNTLYGHIYSEVPLPKFKVGDTVRISKCKSVFIHTYIHSPLLMCRVVLAPSALIGIH